MFKTITDSAAFEAQQRLLKLKLEAMRRPVGARGLTIHYCLYDVEDGDVRRARWSVRMVRWDGLNWQRVGGSIGGYMDFAEAQEKLREECERRNLPRIE